MTDTSSSSIVETTCRLAVAVAVTSLLVLTACSTDGDDDASPPLPAGATTSSASTPDASTPTAGDIESDDTSEPVIGTTIRFTAGSTTVEVTLTEDSATTRDLLSMLPMTLPFEDYGGREKITYPARPFDYDGATGITPEDGDLFSYVPWGNLGFFYDASGLGHSDSLVRLGTTDDLDAVMDLDGQDVTIQIAD